jgi:hypothetical protein
MATWAGGTGDEPERNPSHLNLNGPDRGAANPNDTGFLPAVGGTFRLEASGSNISDADCSIAFAKQFSEIKD